MAAVYTRAHLAAGPPARDALVRPRATTIEPHRRNRLLGALPQDEYARLLPHLELVALDAREVLVEPYTPSHYVCFPHTCVLSLLGYDADGAGLEIQAIGREGMSGLSLFNGASPGPHRCIVQIRGDASQLAAPALLAAAARGPVLNALLHRYAESTFLTVAQAAVCISLHTVAMRCARWLLETYDRVAPASGPADHPDDASTSAMPVTLGLTQEFLGLMLAARRSTVSQVCAALREAGLIRYTRGSVTVLDPDGLQAAACSCYRIVRSAQEAVFARR